MTLKEKFYQELNPLDSEIVHYSRQDLKLAIIDLLSAIRSELPKDKLISFQNISWDEQTGFMKGFNSAIKEMESKLDQ